MFAVFLAAYFAAVSPGLDQARDRQDRAALQRIVEDTASAAAKAPNDPETQYRAALAASYQLFFGPEPVGIDIQ